MQRHIFPACKLLRLRHSAFDAAGDEGELGLALLHGFTRLRLQDNHGPVGSRTVRKEPAIWVVDLIEASVSHDHRASLVERVARDLMEAIPGAGKPGED